MGMIGHVAEKRLLAFPGFDKISLSSSEAPPELSLLLSHSSHSTCPKLCPASTEQLRLINRCKILILS